MIGIPENHTYINVEDEKKDPDSIFHYYKRLISLRKEYGVIQEGDIEFLHRSHPRILAYRRSDEENELMVWNNMGSTAAALPEPFGLWGWKLLIGNYEDEDGAGLGDDGVGKSWLRSLRPYESRVYIRNKTIENRKCE